MPKVWHSLDKERSLILFDGSYHKWNEVRIKAFIEYYGHNFFFNKKVLDLGCGHADISGVLHRLGADVTAVDARQEHLKLISKKYAGVKTVKTDLDGIWPFFGKSFDLTLDLGLMCHLNNFENHLKAVCISTNYLILETAVLDSEDPYACKIKPDNKNIYDGSFNGFSCQVSAANIERILTENNMTFKRMDNTRFNSSPYIYDWQSLYNGTFDFNRRRIWFCEKAINHKQSMSNSQINSLLPPHTGAFSPNLLDSKIPVVHQHLIMSKSPAPPVPFVASVISSNAIPASNSSKIRLFYNYYEEKNPVRKQEIDFCLQKNIDCPYFDLIIVESETNPTFDFMIDKINRLAGPDDISIICNTDIFFDDTIRLANKLQPKEFYALSRWDWMRGNNTRLFDIDHSQDAWIVRGKVENVNGNFQMGKPACDSRLAFEFKKAGYNVTNPSKSIKAYHYHNSQIRRYSHETDTVPGEYLYIKPTNLP